MDLCSHSGKFCPGASRHSRIPVVESELDCRLLARRLTTTSPIRRTSVKKPDTPMHKQRLSHCRKSSGVDKENLNVALRPEQRLPPAGLTAQFAFLPCVAARSNSSSHQILEKNPVACNDGCRTQPSHETDAAGISLGSPEMSSGSTSVWSVDHHDFSEIKVSRDSRRSMEQDISCVRSLPPNSTLRSSSPLCREQCSGAMFGRTTAQRTRLSASTAEIEHVYTGRSLRDLSSITRESTTALHEQISGSSLVGAFCSTFSYPLHSTIIEQCSSISPISTSNTDLQNSSAKDTPLNSDKQMADETLVKSHWRLLGKQESNGSDRELTNIYLSLKNKSVVADDANASHIPLYYPSRPLTPVVQSSSCKFNSSRMFASQYEAERSRINDLGSCGFVENTAIVDVSSPLPTSNCPRTRQHRRLKRQIGRARLDELVHHQTIPRRRLVDNDNENSSSLLPRRSSTPDVGELSDGVQSGLQQLHPSNAPQNPTILDMPVKNPTLCSPSTSSNPNNDTAKQQMPLVDMSETNRNIRGPVNLLKRTQYTNCLDISRCGYYKTAAVPCCHEQNREPYSSVNRTRTSFRHREADNVDSMRCCREHCEMARHNRHAVEVWGTMSRTRRHSTHQQIQHLQRKKVLMRKLRHFRRTLYGDTESNCQFKTFAQI